MKTMKADLLSQVVSTYDQTKTTIQGRVTQKVLNSKTVLGGPLAKYIDVYSDTGLGVPAGSIFITNNNRMFVMIGLAAGVCTLALYDFTLNAGDPNPTYRGKMNFAVPNLAATVHTLRALKVVDNAGTTGWKVYLATVGAVIPNGGLFLVNKVDQSDFAVVVPPTIPFATGSDQKAVYFLQNPNCLYTTLTTVAVSAPGKVQFPSHPYTNNDAVVFSSGTLPTGLVIGTTYFVRNPSANDFELSAAVNGASINTTGSAGSAYISMVHFETAYAGAVLDAVNSKLYLHNGLAATHQYHVRDCTVAPTFPAPALATVTVGTPGKVQLSAHGFALGDAVTFQAGTLPTGLTVGSTYFVKNPTLNDFEVSLTVAGVSINTTGTAGSCTVSRAFGICGAQFAYKTGFLPALSGTLLFTDSEKYAIPVSGHLNNATFSGLPCTAFGTSTNLYLGLLSDLTSNAIMWPSLTTANTLSGANELIGTITPTNLAWDSMIDAFVMQMANGRIVVKKLVNNAYVDTFSGPDLQVREAVANNTLTTFGANTTINIETKQGWLFLVGGTVGQRGIHFMSLTGESRYDISYIVTKVLSMPNSIINTSFIYETLYPYCGDFRLFYRTSGFSSLTGGWALLDTRNGDANFPVANQIQFKIGFEVQSVNFCAGPQIQEFFVGYTSNSELSDYWEYSNTFSSSGTPTKIAFRLKKAYQVAVPKLYFRSYDLSDTLLVAHNTTDNAGQFTYSSDNGVSWLSLGTIPNVVGTLVQYTFTSPPGVDVRPSISEQ